MNSYRAWIEINLDALAHNIASIRASVGEARRIMLVVKADAYGHGAVAIARAAHELGISALGVGTSSEALELQSAGLRLPILVLGTVVEHELDDCIRHGVHLGLHSFDRCYSLQERAKSLGRTARVHVNVDTGMGRLGVGPELAVRLLECVSESSHLHLAGLMSHISAADGALDPSAGAQKRRFDAVLGAARDAGIEPDTVHLCNSAAIATGFGDAYDTVRPGIAALGALPRHLPGAAEQRPVLALRSQVVFLRDIEAGTPVGYESVWRAPRATRIATIALGYNDGVPWRLSGRGSVLIRGCRAPIIGRVSMDYTTLDVGHIPGVQVGDVATLIGRDGAEKITLQDVADLAGTIPYEISCSVGPRVARIYLSSNMDLDAIRPFTGPSPPIVHRKHSSCDMLPEPKPEPKPQPKPQDQGPLGQ
ncbi:MAG: alanine racemase [Planctomycetota bacterium]